MKKECESTKKVLPDYLRGYVFRSTRKRINRHLQDCVVCKSEFEALKRMEETRQFLKNVDPAEGVARRVTEGISALTKLRKILYRPLWLAGIITTVAGISYYTMQPRQLDLEIESIVKTVPTVTATVPAAEPVPEASVATKPAASTQGSDLKPVPPRAEAPLAVSIVPINETTALQRVNEVMSGHEKLRKMKFSGTERRLSGELTAHELLTFFDRVREVAKVRYDRKRFQSFTADQTVPFVLMLKPAAKTTEKQQPASHPVHSAETHTPAETAAPAPPVTTPATSAAP